MPIYINNIENGQIMWVKVNSDRHPNERLYIFTGVAALDTSWHVTDDDSWHHESAFISMINMPGVPEIRPGQWIDSTAIASPSSIQFRETSGRDRWGFAVNSVNSHGPADPATSTDYGITVQIALRGNHIWYHRISFQLNVLTRDVG